MQQKLYMFLYLERFGLSKRINLDEQRKSGFIKMKNKKKSGFSLIEVNMAVLVIGLGILVLFGLFPAGLREGENGMVDTHCALFAESVLEGLRGEVHNNANFTNWNNWRNIGSFIIAVNGANIGLSKPIKCSNAKDKDGRTVSTALLFPANSNPESYIRYIMEVSGDQDGMTRTVNLWVWSGEYSNDDDKEFKRQAEWYTTKYVYGEGI